MSNSKLHNYIDVIYIEPSRCHIRRYKNRLALFIPELLEYVSSIALFEISVQRSELCVALRLELFSFVFSFGKYHHLLVFIFQNVVSEHRMLLGIRVTQYANVLDSVRYLRSICSD